MDTATTVIGITFIASFVIVEILREVVNRHRVKRYGMGGTQDIAIIGMVVQMLLILIQIICCMAWLSETVPPTW